MKPPIGRQSCAWLASALALAACSDHDSGRVVAKVNGAAILADEVDIALHSPGSDDETGRRRQVEKIVIEELLAQQFLRTTPGSATVAQSALSAARREMLARRYVANLVENVPPPADDEIRAFYRNNPLMFAHRRAFLLRELDIRVPPAREAELRQRIAAAASVDELTAWLRQQKFEFTAIESERTGDDLEPEAAAQFLRMKDGQVAVGASPGGLRVVQLLRARDAAVDEASAWPLIEQRLWMERRAAAVDAEVRRLTRMAAISILEGSAREGGSAVGSGPIGRLLFAPQLLSREGALKAEAGGRAAQWQTKEASEK